MIPKGLKESTAKRNVPRGAKQMALAVGTAHLLNDAYASFLHPLLPRLMDKLGLSITVAAALAMVLSFSASVMQPLAGYLADCFGRKRFVIAGPLISGIFLSLIGLAPSLIMLILILVLGGIGSAIFHPPGAAMAARTGEGKGSGLRMSFFSCCGSLGYAIGPLFIVVFITTVGLENMWMAVAPAVLLSFMLIWILPPDEVNIAKSNPPSIVEVLSGLRGPLGIVFLISALGAFVQRVFMTLSPIISFEAGVSETTGALTLSVYLGAQALGSLVSGYLTDRVDRGQLLAWLTALSVPTHMLALWLPPGSGGAFWFAACSGFLNMALLPPVVIMAQEIVPESPAMGSAVVMGLAWAVGSIGLLGTGVLGDLFGGQMAGLLSVPILLVATFLCFHPKLISYRRAVT
jgi:FSR family fosmidomycin resistance protein-like MFS transporter